MRRKLIKLGVALSLFAAALVMGSTAAPLRAAACGPICCDPNCLSVRQCFLAGGSSCRCSQFCTITGVGGDGASVLPGGRPL